MKKYKLKIVFLITLLIPIFQMNLYAQELSDAIKLTRSEQFKKAEGIYKSILKNDPDNGDAYFYFGENYLQKYFSDTLSYSVNEMADSAGSLFHGGIWASPANPLNHVGLGEIKLIKKKISEAELDFEKAMALMPSKTNKSSKLTKKEQAVVFIKMADAYIKAQVYDTVKVFQLLEKAEKLDSKNYDLFIVKGDAFLFIKNDGSSAIICYNKAQNLNPESPRAKLRVGQLWLRAKNYSSALEAYLQAEQVDSNYAPAYRELGYLYYKAHQPAKAKESFEKFLILSAGSITARLQYINCLFDLQEYEESIEQINKIRKTDSTNNDLNRALAYAYYETEQYEKGLFYLNQFFIKTNEKKIRALDWEYYAKLLSKNNNDSLAGEIFLKAFDIDTARTELLSQAANSFIKIKKYDKAMAAIVRMTTIRKNVFNDYFALGRICYNMKDWKKADSVFSICISIDSSNLKGYLYKSYSLVNMDPDTKEGLARPIFEMLINKAIADSVKNQEELKVAYSYLSYCYYVRFDLTNNPADGILSKQYCEKVLALDPKDEKAIGIFKEVDKRLKK